MCTVYYSTHFGEPRLTYNRCAIPIGIWWAICFQFAMAIFWPDFLIREYTTSPLCLWLFRSQDNLFNAALSVYCPLVWTGWWYCQHELWGVSTAVGTILRCLQSESDSAMDIRYRNLHGVSGDHCVRFIHVHGLHWSPEKLPKIQDSTRNQWTVDLDTIEEGIFIELFSWCFHYKESLLNYSC